MGMLRRFINGQNRRKTHVAAFHNRTPFGAGFRGESRRQFGLQGRPLLRVMLGFETVRINAGLSDQLGVKLRLD